MQFLQLWNQIHINGINNSLYNCSGLWKKYFRAKLGFLSMLKKSVIFNTESREISETMRSSVKMFCKNGLKDGGPTKWMDSGHVCEFWFEQNKSLAWPSGVNAFFSDWKMEFSDSLVGAVHTKMQSLLHLSRFLFFTNFFLETLFKTWNWLCINFTALF